MMKKITLLLLLAVTFGYSQSVIEDFEGAAPSLVFTSTMSGSISSTQAIDTKSLEIVAAAGDPWQQTELTFQGDWLDLTTTKSVDVEVYSTAAFNVFAKVVSPASGGPESATSTPHGGTGWETITLTFNQGLDGTGTANDAYGRIFFYYNWIGNNAGDQGANLNWRTAIPGTFYVDNITGMSVPAPATCSDGIQNQGETDVDCGGPNCSACPNPPTGPPTTPPNRAAADVISVFSDVYTDEATDQRQPFGNAVVTEIDFSGNSIISATTPVVGAGFQYQYFSTTPQFLDLSAMTHMHFDFYFEGAPSTPGTFFTVIAQYNGGSNAIQYNVDVTALAANTWHEIDVTFDSFAAAAPRDQIGQVIVQINGPDAYGPFYVDNIYFHKNTTLGTDDFSINSFKTYPNPTQDSWTIETQNVRIASITVYDVLGKSVMAIEPNEDRAVIDGSTLKSGLYFAKVETAEGVSSVKLIKK